MVVFGFGKRKEKKSPKLERKVRVRVLINPNAKDKKMRGVQYRTMKYKDYLKAKKAKDKRSPLEYGGPTTKMEMIGWVNKK